MLIAVVYSSLARIVAVRADASFAILDLFITPYYAAVCDEREALAYNRKMLMAFMGWIGGYTLVFLDQRSHDNFRRDCRKFIGKAPSNERIILSCVVDRMPIPEPQGIFDKSPLQPVLQILETLRQTQQSIDALVCRTKESFSKPSAATPEQIAQAWYIYDGNSDFLHRKDCPDCPQEGCLYAFSSVEKTVSRFPKLCNCVRKEYMRALRARNKKTISKLQFNYLFSLNTRVFHKPDCSRLLYAHQIQGIDDYDTAIERGYVPCKICRPIKPVIETDLDIPENMTLKQKKALILYYLVRKDLENPALGNNRWNKYKAVLISTQNAFISSGRGTTVHLRECPLVYSIEHPKGYMRLAEAKADECVLCTSCNPSSTSDINSYFPLYDDSTGPDDPDVLEKLCRKTGYQYVFVNETYRITTSVGRWYVHPGFPITLDHRHLTLVSGSRRRHTQNVLFLSYRDAFRYIDGHDKNLLKEIIRTKNEQVNTNQGVPAGENFRG